MRTRSYFLLLAILLAGAAEAQAGYPERPITLVTPFAAGGDADQFAQAFARSMGRMAIPQKLNVDNQPGKSGTLASLAVRQAAPDGYTLLLGRVGSHAIQPALDPSTPYAAHDFTVLAVLEINPLICAVKADSPFASARALLSAIRKQPGEIRYSTSGSGTILSFAAQYLLSISGIPINAASALHFDGGREAVAAVAEGKAHFTCAIASSVGPLIRDGKLRGLFTTASGRMESFPQIPNAREAGYRGMSSIVGWSALMGPPGLPGAVVQYWKQALLKVAADPQWLADNARLGGQPVIRLIARPDQYVQDQAALYQRMVLSMKMKL